MKKKPVIKKNIGKMLETLSPAYSVMKGKGPISGALAQLGKTGMSPIGSLALDKRGIECPDSMVPSGLTMMSDIMLHSNRMFLFN